MPLEPHTSEVEAGLRSLLSARTDAPFDVRSYPKPPSPNTVDMWVAQAFTNVTLTWKSYVKGGGIKAVFGEWTLAGEWLLSGLDRDQA